MDTTLVVELLMQALRMLAVLAGPPLLALLVVGLVIGVLQAATQVNEATVAFVPKLVALGAVLALAGGASIALFVDYLRELIQRIPAVAG
jgi:flagellar biosynthetic protein FliQ